MCACYSRCYYWVCVSFLHWFSLHLEAPLDESIGKGILNPMNWVKRPVLTTGFIRFGIYFPMDSSSGAASYFVNFHYPSVLPKNLLIYASSKLCYITSVEFPNNPTHLAKRRKSYGAI